MLVTENPDTFKQSVTLSIASDDSLCLPVKGLWLPGNWFSSYRDYLEFIFNGQIWQLNLDPAIITPELQVNLANNRVGYLLPLIEISIYSLDRQLISTTSFTNSLPLVTFFS